LLRPTLRSGYYSYFPNGDVIRVYISSWVPAPDGNRDCVGGVGEAGIMFDTVELWGMRLAFLGWLG